MTDVCEGDHAIVEMVTQPEFIKVVRISSSGKEKLGKLSFYTKEAIGMPYGTVFEVDRGKLIPKQAATESAIDSLIKAGNLEKGADNRDLRDDRSHQRLSSIEIHDMKKQGAKRHDVIKHIVESSQTFSTKTEYSQVKYLQRKKRQHLTDVRILKPTLRTLWRVYNQKAPLKICYMRNDTLAMLLLRANARPGGRYLVLETCNGLIAAAMAQRLAGFGHIVQLHTGNQPSQAALEVLPLGEARNAVLPYPVTELEDLEGQRTRILDGIQREEEEAEAAAARGDDKDSSGSHDGGAGKGKEEEAGKEEEREEERAGKAGRRGKRRKSGQPRAKKAKTNEDAIARRQRGRRRRLEALEQLQHGHFDGLVLAMRFRPAPILRALFKFVSPSRPIVIYHQFREPLIECIAELRGRAVDMEIKESFLREYQVLPQRTHPMNNTNACSGYLLTATTLAVGQKAAATTTATTSASAGETASTAASSSSS